MTEEQINKHLRQKIEAQQPKQQAQPVQQQPVQPAQQPQQPQKPISEEFAPKFGYETTLSERQDRNDKIAASLFQKAKDFDENKMFSEIRTLAPDVTEGEVNQTVQDIKDRFESLKMTDELRNINNDLITQNVLNGTWSMSDLD